MAKLEFEEVWQLLRQLNGKCVTTLVRKSRNRVVCVKDTQIVRDQIGPDGSWERGSPVSKNTFREVWCELRQTGYYQGPAAFTSACLVKIPELRVEVVEGRSPRTIVLQDP